MATAWKTELILLLYLQNKALKNYESKGVHNLGPLSLPFDYEQRGGFADWIAYVAPMNFTSYFSFCDSDYTDIIQQLIHCCLTTAFGSTGVTMKNKYMILKFLSKRSCCLHKFCIWLEG